MSVALQMALNTDLLAAREELRGIDLLKTGKDPVTLSERDLTLLSMMRLALTQLGSGGGGGGGGTTIDNAALASAIADAIAGEILTVSGDSVNESTLATAIANALTGVTLTVSGDSVNETALATAIVNGLTATTLTVSGDSVNEATLATAIADAVAAKTLVVSGDSVNEAALGTAVADAIAARTLTVSGDAVDEAALATAIANAIATKTLAVTGETVDESALAAAIFSTNYAEESTVVSPNAKGLPFFFRGVDNKLRIVSPSSKLPVDAGVPALGQMPATNCLPTVLASDGLVNTSLAPASPAATGDTSDDSNLMGFMKRLMLKLTSVTTKVPASGTAGTPSTNVITVQGISNGRNIATSLTNFGTPFSISFANSVNSGTFGIYDKYVGAIFPVLASAPTITLQITFDAGVTWADTNVVTPTSATVPTFIDSDAFLRIIAGINLANAYRFKSSTAITATINMRYAHA